MRFHAIKEFFNFTEIIMSMGYDKVSRPLTDIVKLCNKKTHYIQEYYYDFYKEDKDTLVISFKLKGKEDFKYEFKK